MTGEDASGPASTDRTDPPALPDPVDRNAHWTFFQFLFQNIFCFWLGYRARGTEYIPAEGGGVVVANHQSFLDPLLVGLPLERPVSYLARDSLFRVPVIGWILRHTYVIPISQDNTSTASIREAIRRLKHGFLVGIFPEGSRTYDGRMGEFKPGFISLVRRSKLPIYPVGIAGAYAAMPRGAWFVRPHPVRIVFGEPIPRNIIEGFGRDDDALVLFVRKRVEQCQAEAEAWLAEQTMRRQTPGAHASGS